MLIHSSSIAILSRNLFVVSVEGRRLYVLILAGCLLWTLAFVQTPRSTRPWAMKILLAVAWTVVFLQVEDPLSLLNLYILFCLMVSYLWRSDFQLRCALAALGYAVFWLIYLSSPLLFAGVNGLSDSFSRGVSSLILDVPHVLGPSASGFHVLLPFLFFFFAAYRKNAATVLQFLAYWLVLWAAYQGTGRILLSGFGQVTFQFVLLPLATLIFLFLPAVEPRRREGVWSNKGWLSCAWVSALLVVLVPLNWAFSAGDAGKRRVLFYEDGFFDLKVPTFDEFGAMTGGLFGMLPRHLEHHGFACSSFRGEITRQKIQGASVLVITNPQRQWTEEDLESVWNFVREGGSLLVQGDHTDIMGTQKVLNELLKPIRAKFLFDSGYPCKPMWFHCLELRPHPITSNVSSDLEVGISVGATLDIEQPTFPVVVGKYGFSDAGNYANKQGAFLGNYSYELGEKLGDVVLVAASQFGRGKVLVFGDTSSFQNGALAGNFPSFVHQVFDWLDRTGGSQNTVPWEVGGWSLLFLSLLWFQRSARPGRTLAVTLVFLFSLSASRSWTSEQYAFEHEEGDIFWLDISHQERWAFAPLKRNSAGSICANAIRNGFLPYIMKEFTREDLLRGKIFLSLAPARPFSPTEVEVLKDLMNQGGCVVLASGYRDKAGSESVLREFQLDLGDVPLGPVPIVKTRDDEKKDPQFVDAWPIVGTSEGVTRNLLRMRIPDDSVITVEGKRLLRRGAVREYVAVREDLEILYRHKGFATAVGRKVGRGCFLFIADSLFLGDDNLENLTTYHEGNIYFLKALFDWIRGNSS